MIKVLGKGVVKIEVVVDFPPKNCIIFIFFDPREGGVTPKTPSSCIWSWPYFSSFFKTFQDRQNLIVFHFHPTSFRYFFIMSRFSLLNHGF